jgi:hypothetical protein
MPKKPSLLEVKPLFPSTDRRRKVPLAEVDALIGYSVPTLRGYAADGTIPGATKAGKRKRWYFERFTLEKWWQKFNGGKAD